VPGKREGRVNTRMSRDTMVIPVIFRVLKMIFLTFTAISNTKIAIARAPFAYFEKI
jgi:hypothetical protein